jgi:hypothetical protein
MSQQYNKVEKRKRHRRYLKRHKEQHKRVKAPSPSVTPAPTTG